MYHVALELTPEQIKQLKLQATERDQSVKSYITGLVIKSLDKNAKKEENA